MPTCFIRRLVQSFSFGPTIEEISPQDALRGVQDGSVIIIDVRESEEWAKSGTPQGSHRISMNDANFGRVIGELLDNRPDAIAALSCTAGMRSKTAIKLLRKSGIESLKSVSGGINRWSVEDLPIDP